MAASPQNSMLQDRPVLDEATFQQLLAAAYVLQEHNDRLRAKVAAQARSSAPKLPPQPTSPDYSQTLSEIVETQALIHTHQLDLHSAALLIAQRVQAMTNAAAAVIGIVEGNQVNYRAISGSATSDSGLRVPIDLALSAECIRTGYIIQCGDAEQDPCIPSELCRKSGTKSFIAVPIHHDDHVAGVLEVRFQSAFAFQEQDVRTSQLMAGLAAEAISRAAELEWKRALAAERATMMEVLEKLKPQLDRLATQAASPQTKEEAAITAQEIEAAVSCRGCGGALGPEEAFCGVCGTRVERGGDIQSKWASMWHLKEAADRKKAATVAIGGSADVPVEVIDELPVSAARSEMVALTLATAVEDVALVTELPIEGDRRWISASQATHWLESIKVHPGNTKLRRMWTAHRANFYVGISALLLLLVISGWGSQGSWEGSGVAHRNGPAKPRLTLFEEALVTMGIAEAPPALAPEYKGNPDTAVWEDTHTATYYCPGADLYGKTPGGKYATQRDAQDDQFEPASRKVCK